MRAQLIDKLQMAVRETQRAAVIKDELDAARTPPASLASAIRLFVLCEVKAGR